MDQIGTLFRELPKPQKYASERGELFKYFLEHVNPGRLGKYPPLTYSRLGRELKGITTQQLYAIKSSMDDGMRRRVPAGAAFWTAVKSFRQKPTGVVPTVYRN
jgi:hypothetical protein